MRLLPPLLVALVLALCGCSGTTAGQGFYLGAGPTAPTPTTPVPTTSAATTTSTTTETTSTPPTTATPPPTTTSAPPPTTSAVPTTSPGGELSDDDWVVESFEYGGDFGLFTGTARIRNDAGTVRSAIYTFTLFDDETLVTTLIGSSNQVGPGETVTVSLVGTEPYVEGEYSVDFQVDISF